MFSNYFHQVNQSVVDLKSKLNKNTVGYHIDCYSDNIFPNIKNADIAIIVVPEYRGGLQLVNNHSFVEFRKSFYSLFQGTWQLRIVDFGDLKIGLDVKDTYFALNDIVSSLLSQSVFPILIGGTQDLIYPMYQAYESFLKGVNILCIDSRFDLIDDKIDSINSRNFLGYIIKQDPNHLSHFINLGYQSYLCQNDESNLLEKMCFETCRLGNLRDNIRESEPYLRNSDIVGLDLSSIKQSDSPGTTFPSPNGLEAHHCCAIARYAGMSDRVSSFGIFEFLKKNDNMLQTTNLIAQIIWYFLEGFSLRVKDSPTFKTINSNYKKYYIPIKDSNLQFIFYKSKHTGRWWVSSSMELDNNKNYNEQIIPCSYEDYLGAISGDIPSRLYRVMKRKHV